MTGTRPTALPGIPEPRESLPSLVATVKALKEALEVRTGARGDPLDTAVTFRDLKDGGIADVYTTTDGAGRNRRPGGSPGGPTFLQPRRDRPRPLSSIRNIRTRAVWDGIMVLWDPPSPEEAGTEYSSVEIWAAEEIEGAIPSFAQAVLVGTSPGTMFLHPNLGLGRTWWYWLRKVGFTYSGTTQYGPYVPSESARGVKGSSSEDPELVVGLLQERITQDFFDLGFADTIARGEMQTAATAGIGTVSSRILAVDLGLNAAIQQVAAIRTRQDVVEASYGVKIDVDGYVAGFGLLVRDNGQGGIENNTNPQPGVPRFESSFIIAADRFGVVFPQQPGAPRGEPVIPFTVGLVRGIPTVGIEGRLMVDGTIAATAIQAGTIGAREINAASIWAEIVRARRIIGEDGIATGDAPDYRVEIGNKNSSTVFWYGRDEIGGDGTVFDFSNTGNVRLAGQLDVTGKIRSGDGAGGQSAYAQIGGAEGFAFWAGVGATTEENARFAVRNNGDVLLRGLALTVPTGSGSTSATVSVVANASGGTAPVMVLAYAVVGDGNNGREKTIRTTIRENGGILDDLRISTIAYTLGAPHFALLAMTPGDHTLTYHVEVSDFADGPWRDATVFDARMLIFQTTAQ